MTAILTADQGADIIKIRAAVQDDIAVRDLTQRCRSMETELETAEKALEGMPQRLVREMLAKQLATLDKHYVALEKAQNRAEENERRRQKEERLVLLQIAAKNDLKDAALAMRNYRVLMLKVLDQHRQIQREGGTLFSHPFDRSLIDRFSCQLIEDEEQRLWALQSF